MFSVCYILTQRMSALEILFNDSALYNNNNNSNVLSLLVRPLTAMCC